MPLRIAAAALPACLVLASPASAADPFMPLSQVRAGMQCTGLSVVRGTDVASFSIEVLDVVDGEAVTGGPRILVRASGPAVDETGLGPGFSGSPILCPDAQGVARNIGAISEAVGEYGGKVALATPIEAILGNPVDAPTARRDRAVTSRARPLAAPLTVTGLSPALSARLQAAAARRGRIVLAAPAGPLGSYPPQQLRPGSAFGVSLSTGDLHLSAIGTVAYVDGSTVWGFGHTLEGLGRRSLFLEDAYVFRVINNPLGIPGAASTYKLASTGHDLGTLTNDALDAVVGRVGGLPPTVPVRVRATDLDSGRSRTLSTDVADESGIDQPSGSSALSFVAPLAVAEAGGTVLRGSPARLTGRACVAIDVREIRRPLRFCNRYITDAADLLGTGNAVGGLVASDVSTALGFIDAFKLGRIHVTRLTTRVAIERGQRLAFLRRVHLPARVRPGQRVRATLVLRHVRGPLERRRVTLRMARDLRPGRRRVRLTGTDVDLGGSDFFGDLSIIFGEGPSGGDPGPASLKRLARAVRRIHRYDGVRIKSGGDGDESGRRAYLARDVRIAGRASTRVRVVRR
jgi:hypothetical protein